MSETVLDQKQIMIIIPHGNKGKNLSPATQFKKGHIISAETRLKISLAVKGMKYPPRSLEHRRKLSDANSGDKSKFWRGGIYPEHKKQRLSLEMKLWREAVFQRDNYTCIWCGAKNKEGLGKTVKLNADHIKSFAHFPDLRFTVDNGRTLCEDCHKTTDTYGWKGVKR